MKLKRVKHTFCLSVSSREEVEERDEGGAAMGLDTLETFDANYRQFALNVMVVVFMIIVIIPYYYNCCYQ